MELSDYSLDNLKLLHSRLTSSIRLQESISQDKDPLRFWADEVESAIKDREFEDNKI